MTLPNLIVGTVGGGTRSAVAARLPRHHGRRRVTGQARAFAEVAAAVALAGELSITGALAAGHFTRAHQRLARGVDGRRRVTQMNRWVVYQRERFPLAGSCAARGGVQRVGGVLLVAARAATWRLPSARALVVAFVTSLLFFLQLRIADEFKDFAEDARFRPYRPVPRGLVTLRELAWVGVAGGSRAARRWRCGSTPSLVVAARCRRGCISR